MSQILSGFAKAAESYTFKRYFVCLTVCVDSYKTNACTNMKLRLIDHHSEKNVARGLWYRDSVTIEDNF